MAALRMALLTIRLVSRTKTALFFTFLFPVIFLFVYAGLFAHGNPQAVAYLFGPVVTLNVMGSGFWGLGLQSVMQRERGSLRRYRLAPIGAATVVVSNLIANYLLGLPTIGLLVFCASAFFHMPMKIGWLTLLALVTVGSFAFAGFGLTIASIANTMQEAQVYNNLIWLTLLFLSGTTIPLPLLPNWIQRVATFLPATYLVSSFQGIMMRAEPLRQYVPHLVALVSSGFFGLLFAWKLFRWEKEERIPSRNKLYSLAFVFPFLLMGLWMNARANPTASWALTYHLMTRGAENPDEAGGTAVDSLIENFERGVPYEETLKGWRASTDPEAPELSVSSPGAAGTQHALRVKGQGARTLATGEPLLLARHVIKLPGETQHLRGVEFWVKGDPHAYQINLKPAAGNLPHNPGITLIPSGNWQMIQVPVGWLAAPPSGDRSTHSWEMEISVVGPTGEFDFEIDEIRFY